MAGSEQRNAPIFLLNVLARLASCFSFAIVMLLATNSRAGVGGSISGTVKDESGAVVADATVTSTNIDTGVRGRAATNGSGFYSFPELPVGRYTIAIKKTGFKIYQRTAILIDTNSTFSIDAVLNVGAEFDAVTVTNTAERAETSDTQMGDVIGGKTVAAVPLNGRSYTDLLALQPGVVPATSLTSNTQQDVGVSALSPSGGLNPGTISINGQREFSNAFTVNGSDAEEDVNAGTAIIPNLDSVAEFRILTSNFDAEYGGHSGGQINVVTKSGTNAYHGDAFEFLRNTNLDARNYFSPTRGRFDQNQFGGTLGGPIRRSRTFFFADYQGTRLTQGLDTGLIPVPTLAERNGVFPNGDIVQPIAWSAPAKYLLPYIPLPNVGTNSFVTSAYNETLRDDKGACRLDHNSPWGTLSAYYFLDEYRLNNPYPVAQSGASVPGFNALYLGRAQLLSLGDTKTLGSTSVNEFHFTYMRDHSDLGKPVGGLGVSLASQGFMTGVGTPGIVPLNPQGEGVENVVFNAFSIGTNANELKQVNNIFQWTDNFSKVVGRHSLKFGAEFHYDQVNTDPIAQFNGNFLFTGSATESDFEDFLMGLPSQYNQSQLQPFYGRNQYWGLYAQDGWRLHSNLTLNYGLRWDRITPWYEKNNGISTFKAGEQSLVFPGAPAGILFPGDPGVRRTLATPGNLDFAPRIGVAYSPAGAEGTLRGRILGGPGKTSVRAGFGMYYSAIEALTVGILAGNAPFGITYSSPAPPLFATPFITASTGQFQGQPFPFALVTQKASRKRPDTNVDWSQYEPISGIPGYAATNRIPYVEEYMLSLERQLGANTVISVSYVGTQSHRLLVMEEANPGNPALCESLSQPSEVAPGSPTCGPFGEGNVFTTASGQVIRGSRGPLGSNFGSDTVQTTIGKSNYNALQLSLRHSSGRLELALGYTYGKSLDESSNLGEEVNPLNPALNYALSSFDVRHNFVASYNYKLPFERLLGVANRWTQGWEVSGITHFSSGLPVTLVNYGDNSLLGAQPNGINNYGIDEPDYSGGALNVNHNPRNGRLFFSTSQFSENALGTPGTARRRFFHGPGMDNYDVALLRNVRLTESRSLQFRVEGFNVFNHAQFFGSQSVDGNIGSSAFGRVVSATSPRLVQLGAKFFF